MSVQSWPKVPTSAACVSYIVFLYGGRRVLSGASERKGRREASGARVTSSSPFRSPENCFLGN